MPKGDTMPEHSPARYSEELTKLMACTDNDSLVRVHDALYVRDGEDWQYLHHVGGVRLYDPRYDEVKTNGQPQELKPWEQFVLNGDFTVIGDYFRDGRHRDVGARVLGVEATDLCADALREELVRGKDQLVSFGQAGKTVAVAAGDGVVFMARKTGEHSKQIVAAAAASAVLFGGVGLRMDHMVPEQPVPTEQAHAATRGVSIAVHVDSTTDVEDLSYQVGMPLEQVRLSADGKTAHVTIPQPTILPKMTHEQETELATQLGIDPQVMKAANEDTTSTIVPVQDLELVQVTAISPNTKAVAQAVGLHEQAVQAVTIGDEHMLAMRTHMIDADPTVWEDMASIVSVAANLPENAQQKTTVVEGQTPAEVAPTPQPAPEVITPEAKYHKDIAEVQKALEHAVQTGGDLGPLNHMVVYSPLFNPRHDLPGDLESTRRIRYMPPSNLMEIPGLKYEFSRGAGDMQRYATNETVATTLYLAYAYQQYLAQHPELQATIGNSCLRIGDLSAKHDHKTHHGSMVDYTSSLNCDVQHGHQVADGPVLWLNRSTGGVSGRIENPHYDRAMDMFLLQALMGAHIGDNSLVGSILYNIDGVDVPRLKKAANHSNHAHINTAPAFKDLHLKEFAVGGERPELNLDGLRASVFGDYVQGYGVPGVSDMPLSTLEQPTQPAPVAPEAVVAAQEVTASPEDQFKWHVGMLLNEIAAGEGGYDSVNRGVAGDTKVGSEAYQRLFSGRQLSQLTIAEIQASDAFAVGKYQFIPKTLESAVRALGFDRNRVFDSATQDELATKYLLFAKRPALANYLRGQSDDVNAAVTALCMEFASMPCLDGTGHYDGDRAGNNAVGGTERVAHIRALLTNVRNAFVGSILTAYAEANLPPVEPEEVPIAPTPPITPSTTAAVQAEPEVVPPVTEAETSRGAAQQDDVTGPIVSLSEESVRRVLGSVIDDENRINDALQQLQVNDEGRYQISTQQLIELSQ